tara:strand:+ start:262 stop:492 length:231 start_codon:yes stop_codon:yes gene_type:complete
MRNNTFHNGKSLEENFDIKKNTHPSYNIDQKINVDINKLLNRVKMDHKNEKKQKIIFFSLSVLLISSMGIFISIIK